MENEFKTKFLDSEILELFIHTPIFNPSIIKKEWLSREYFLSYIVTQPQIVYFLFELHPSFGFNIFKYLIGYEPVRLQEINTDLAEKMWELVRYADTDELFEQSYVLKHISKDLSMLKYRALEKHFELHIPQDFDNLENILLASYYINLFYKNKTKFEVTHVPDPKHFELLNHLLKIPNHQIQHRFSKITFMGTQRTTPLVTELEKFKQFCIMTCQMNEFNYNLLAWYYVFCHEEIIEQQSFLYILLDVKWEYIPIIIKVLKAADIPISHITPNELSSLTEYITEHENDLDNLTDDALFTVFSGIFLDKRELRAPIKIFTDPNIRSYLKAENYAKFLATNPFMLRGIKNLDFIDVPTHVDLKTLNSYNAFSLDHDSKIDLYNPYTRSLITSQYRSDVLSIMSELLDKSLLLYQFIQFFGSSGIFFNSNFSFTENIQRNRPSVETYLKMYLQMYPQRKEIVIDFLKKHNYILKHHGD